MKDRASVQFTCERTYTLRHPKFKLFKNVEYLDTDKLSKGSHIIELGKFEGCHCDCSITGEIRNGMITKLNYPKCEKATKISPGFLKVLQAARKKLAKHGPAKWQNIPVKELARRGGRAGLVIVITTIDDCFELCVGNGPGQMICWMCCPALGWCIGPSDPQVL
jgi:hypothetical protein